MKRVVITGATSMIGVALIEECIQNNVEVLAIVRTASKRLERLPKSNLLQIVECPLEHMHNLAVNGSNYDVFYHLAWDFVGREYRDNPFLQEKNIQYTLEAVELAKKLGCYKFIGAGSQAEYGYVEGIINEKTPVNPGSAYGIAKYAAGRLSAKLCEQYGIVHIWGRIFSVYGKNDNEGTMLNYAIDKFLKNEVAEFSAGTQMWDYLFETDAGKIFYRLGVYVNNNRVFRIASGKSEILKCFIEITRNLIDETIKCDYKNNNNLKLLSLQAEISDLEREIGFSPQIPFTEGIKQVIEYRKKR